VYIAFPSKRLPLQLVKNSRNKRIENVLIFTDGEVYSSQWITTIFYKALTNSSGPYNKVEMSFARAPSEYGFRLYTISLYEAGTSRPVSQLNATDEVSVTGLYP
jgi:hypothetical protein